MRVLLALPPLSQLNSPYPATPYLSSFLNQLGHNPIQADWSLELTLALFSREGIAQIEDRLRSQNSRKKKNAPPILEFFLENTAQYLEKIDPVVRFLQGRDPSLALQIGRSGFLPEGPRFSVVHENPELLAAFGDLGVQDRAKYLATLFLDDLADLIREGIDERFQFSKYGESLAASQISFAPLLENLQRAPTLVDEFLEKLAVQTVAATQPQLIGLTIPFPGNLYGGLRAAAAIKREYPKIPIILGGGYINTELRELSDSRIFDFIDYLIFDDGELPIARLFEFLEQKTSRDRLVRTKACIDGKVVDFHDSKAKDPPFREVRRPLYEGLPLHKYLSLLEMPNPMHRLWSDFRWNKLILAHGCYWRRCSFCDISLDYIKRYDPHQADTLVAQMEELIEKTGISGFHFVDEAAPPNLLKAVSERIVGRGLTTTWWGNIRFDKQFTPELAQLMAQAGCVAVTGGLEVASPRILEKIQKGTSVEQVAQVAHAFSEAGIYVHAYLMYGFPSQTTQETIDSLEVVRQLFAEGCIQSAFWHRFATTVHSPVGKNPDEFGITLQKPIAPLEGIFAKNDIPFTDPTACDHDQLGIGLRKALYNFMHGVGLSEDVRFWFEHPVPKAKVPRTFVRRALARKLRKKS